MPKKLFWLSSEWLDSLNAEECGLYVAVVKE